MKIVATADWHVHNFEDFSRTLLVDWDDKLLRYTEVIEEDSPQCKEMNSRLFNILGGLCDIRDYCLQNSITDVLMAGDCFHKRGTIDVTVYNTVYRVIDSFYNCGITIHMIAGNHDQVDASQQPVSSIHGFREIAHVIESPVKFNIEETEVIAVPYSKDKEFILSSIKSLKGDCKQPDKSILMCHLGVTGGNVGSGMYSMKDEYTLGDLMSDNFKYVVIGHYHQPQLLSYNAIYAGTPVQNSFSDELKGKSGYNGFFVLDTDKRYDIQFIPVIAPRFLSFNSAYELGKADPEYLKGNYVRVVSTDSKVEEIQDTLEELLGDDKGNVRLELEKEYNTEQRSEIGVSNSFEDSVKIYAKERYNGDFSVDSVIELGLEILSEATVGGKNL